MCTQGQASARVWYVSCTSVGSEGLHTHTECLHYFSFNVHHSIRTIEVHESVYTYIAWITYTSCLYIQTPGIHTTAPPGCALHACNLYILQNRVCIIATLIIMVHFINQCANLHQLHIYVRTRMHISVCAWLSMAFHVNIKTLNYAVAHCNLQNM